MNEAAKSLAQMKKANKLVRLAFRKNGPKSFKRGQGALLQALLVDDGATQPAPMAAPVAAPIVDASASVYDEDIPF